MRIDVVTIFPAYLEPLRLSLIGSAQAAGLLDLRVHDLREHTHDRHRTDEDDKEDRLLAELEEQDRQREPRDRGHGLQPGDHRPDRRAQHSRLGDDHPKGQADDRGDREADEAAGHRDADGGPELRCRPLPAELGQHRTRAGQQVARLPATPDHALPGEQGEPGGSELGPGRLPESPAPGGAVRGVEGVQPAQLRVDLAGPARGASGGASRGVNGHGGPPPPEAR